MPSLNVVAIGASAGGLEALTELFRALAANTGMAFVIVQHLAPSHDSLLVDILSRNTSMPVVPIVDGLTAKANHVYVGLPGGDIEFHGGKFSVVGKSVTPLPCPNINIFLSSLADAVRADAIAVVLSGTGADGADGIIAIHDAGGITFAQDAASAAYSSMPEQAVATGLVDFILPPKGIAEKLAEIARDPRLRYSHDSTQLDHNGSEYFDAILSLLRQQSGHDFSHYKDATIKRRLRRRMILNKLDYFIGY